MAACLQFHLFNSRNQMCDMTSVMIDLLTQARNNKIQINVSILHQYSSFPAFQQYGNTA